MYRPLPDGLTIKNSPIEGLGLFATIDIIYNHNKWPINLDQSISFPYVLKGSNYLIKEFPNEENYQDTKEKVQEL